MIGHIGCTDCAEENRIESFQSGEAAFGNVIAVLFVVVTAPGEFFDVQFEAAVALAEHFENLQAGGDDLGADTVAGYGGNVVLTHANVPFTGQGTKGSDPPAFCHPARGAARAAATIGFCLATALS